MESVALQMSLCGSAGVGAHFSVSAQSHVVMAFPHATPSSSGSGNEKAPEQQADPLLSL